MSGRLLVAQPLVVVDERVAVVRRARWGDGRATGGVGRQAWATGLGPAAPWARTLRVQNRGMHQTGRPSVDLNADLGEEVTDDAALLEVVTSANVACGYHAGDAGLMRAVCDDGGRARRAGRRAGVLPGPGGLRTPAAWTCRATLLAEQVADQVGRLRDRCARGGHRGDLPQAARRALQPGRRRRGAGRGRAGRVGRPAGAGAARRSGPARSPRRPAARRTGRASPTAATGPTRATGSRGCCRARSRARSSTTPTRSRRGRSTWPRERGLGVRARRRADRGRRPRAGSGRRWTRRASTLRAVRVRWLPAGAGRAARSRSASVAEVDRGVRRLARTALDLASTDVVPGGPDVLFDGVSDPVRLRALVTVRGGLAAPTRADASDASDAPRGRGADALRRRRPRRGRPRSGT